MVMSFVFHLMMLMTATTESLEFDIGHLLTPTYYCSSARVVHVHRLLHL
jgi:hypothetical protein